MDENPFDKFFEDDFESIPINDNPYNKKCEHENCSENATVECVLPDYEEGKDIPDYYCYEHAFEHGFCKCCGTFWAGIENFDFGNGFCEHCNDQLEADNYDDEEYFNN